MWWTTVLVYVVAQVCFISDKLALNLHSICTGLILLVLYIATVSIRLLVLCEWQSCWVLLCNNIITMYRYCSYFYNFFFCCIRVVCVSSSHVCVGPKVAGSRGRCWWELDLSETLRKFLTFNMQSFLFPTEFTDSIFSSWCFYLSLLIRCSCCYLVSVSVSSSLSLSVIFNRGWINLSI
jgi:hypothetical protein